MAHILIGYDIHQNARRRRVFKLLRALTPCYQKSFFDCEIPANQLPALFAQLTALMDPHEDGLIIASLYPGHETSLGQRWTHGGDSLFLVN